VVKFNKAINKEYKAELLINLTENKGKAADNYNSSILEILDKENYPITFTDLCEAISWSWVTTIRKYHPESYRWLQIYVVARPISDRNYGKPRLRAWSCESIILLYSPAEIDRLDLYFFLQYMACSYDSCQLEHYINYRRIYTSLCGK
jgi:hypothetical protein